MHSIFSILYIYIKGEEKKERGLLLLLKDVLLGVFCSSCEQNLRLGGSVAEWFSSDNTERNKIRGSAEVWRNDSLRLTLNGTKFEVCRKRGGTVVFGGYEK